MSYIRLSEAWPENLHEDAELEGKRFARDYIQIAAIDLARNVMDKAGFDEDERSKHRKFASSEGKFRDEGISYDIRRLTKPIPVEADALEPINGKPVNHLRILEEHRDRHYRRFLPLFLGELALQNEPEVTQGYIQVIKFTGQHGDKGLRSASVGLPDSERPISTIHCARPEKLENFLNEITAAATSVGINQITTSYQKVISR